MPARARRLVALAMVGAVLSSLLSLPCTARAQAQGEVLIKEGFLTGNAYKELPVNERRRYVMGVLDGMLLAPIVGAPKPRLEWLETCIVGMTDFQVAAIVEKYLNENPVRWHGPMHAIAFSAIRSACVSGAR